MPTQPAYPVLPISITSPAHTAQDSSNTNDIQDLSFVSNSDTLYSASSSSSSPNLRCKESFEETSVDLDYHSDHDASEWEYKKSSRRARIIHAMTRVVSAKLYYIAGVIAVVLLVSITSTSTPVVKHVTSSINDFDVASLKEKITSFGQSKTTCDDPFAMPGYIWYGPKSQDVRWVPYKYLDQSQIADSNDVELYDPEKESQANKTAMNTPPDADKLPLEFSKLFKTSQRRKDNAEALEFMRNKHIMIYGSSLDREMTKMFCNDHEHEAQDGDEGKAFVYAHHRHTYCHFKDYNFTLSSAMHFGLHQTKWFHGDDDPKIGVTIEQRLDSVVSPLVDKFGKPDLLVFSSGLWDLMFFNKIERRKDAKYSRSWYRPVSYERLMWQRSRLAEVVGKLRETLPGTTVMYRTTTQPGERRSEKDDEMIAVFQINQSARMVMDLLKVPLFHWSELIKGSHSYKDFVHYETDSRQNWLYGEMLLYTLKQISSPGVDTSCWLDR
ncbi:hypothetical protein P389DRAFT_170324 [Cystobasidium minutum MCA 4210]|uniref:uncharacterized protein n=1 Tax=Cystobasidium minutum MCA 4210 TaxID=1397322 RepID=UPI0034CE42A4|eukprot:jgi/Rhomi1/170324/fgenesh1_kg.4_\